MKVVLLQNISGMGKVDEIKEVNEGYAHNFLFPKHLAVQASEKNIRELNERKRKEAKNSEYELRGLQELAEHLNNIEIVFKEKASETGVLYAAVGQQRVVDELSKRGIKLNKNQVENLMIKKAGECSVKIKLNHGLEAELSLRVEIL